MIYWIYSADDHLHRWKTALKGRSPEVKNRCPRCTKSKLGVSFSPAAPLAKFFPTRKARETQANPRNSKDHEDIVPPVPSPEPWDSFLQCLHRSTMAGTAAAQGSWGASPQENHPHLSQTQPRAGSRPCVPCSCHLLVAGPSVISLVLRWALADPHITGLCAAHPHVPQKAGCLQNGLTTQIHFPQGEC